MDTHPYFSFTGAANPQPLDVNGPQGQPGGQWPAEACAAFGPRVDNRYAPSSGFPNFGVLMNVNVVGRTLASPLQANSPVPLTTAGCSCWA